MNKHTPGPWTAIEGRHNSDVEAANHWGSIVDSDDFCIAAIWADAPNTEANAELLAAAPDLLEALKDVAAFGTLRPRLVSVVRAAIAKAEGGTT